MKSFFYSFLILAVTWPFAASTALCPSACESALSYVVFSGNATKQQCTNQLHIVSYYSCLRQYCPGEAVEAYTALKKTCKSTAAIPTIANVTVDVDGLAKITAKDLYKKAPVKQPVTLEESLYLLSVRTITSAAAQDEINVRYGHAMYGFWALTILVSSLMKLWEFLTTKYPRVAQKGWVNKASTKLRQHVTIPALAGKRTAENIGWCTVPPRLQSLVIIAFIALNLALCVSGYDVFPGNLKRPSIPNQVSRLIGRRTGVLIMANLPLMWTFAMRNNILSWISGWTFATFSSFHRWIARVVMAELVAHAVAYSLSDYYSGGLKKYYAQWPQEYWWWGVVSIIAGSFATASAIYPIRQRFYDAFLLGHIVLAMLFLVGTWFHIKKQDNEFDMYFWPCVAVWAFDRALRLGRVLVLNWSVTQAEVVYNPSSDMLHLNVMTGSIVQPAAGTYYYVYVLHGLKFWESHPFTLHSWERQAGGTGGRTTLKFLVRPLDGFTGRLRDLAIKKVDTEYGSDALQKRSVLALVEGPYGHTSDTSSHSSALFVVGGSGITVAISHLRSLDAMLEKGHVVATRRAHIVWAVRHAELASGVLKDDIMPWLSQSKIGSRMDIRFDIYTTKETAQIAPYTVKTGIDSALNSSGEDLESPKGLDEGGVSVTDVKKDHKKKSEGEVEVGVQFYTGRPLLEDICLSYADQTSHDDGKAALICCGPPSMADTVRAIVVRALQAGSYNLDFFPESFSW